MKQLNEALFRSVCLTFSAVVLILFLLTTIDTAAERDKRGRLASEVQALSDSNERLRVQVQTAFSPEEIERYARECLGMKPAAPGQIVYLELQD